MLLLYSQDTDYMHFIHSYIKNVSAWDPTARFKYC